MNPDPEQDRWALFLTRSLWASPPPPVLFPLFHYASWGQLISLHLCLAVYNKCLEIIEVYPAMSINSVHLGSLRLLWWERARVGWGGRTLPYLELSCHTLPSTFSLQVWGFWTEAEGSPGDVQKGSEDTGREAEATDRENSPAAREAGGPAGVWVMGSGHMGRTPQCLLCSLRLSFTLLSPMSAAQAFQPQPPGTLVLQYALIIL